MNSKPTLFAALSLSIIAFACTSREVKKVYYSNGKLKDEYEVSDGRRNGYYKTYYENGNLNEKYNEVDGLREGEYISYFPSGALEIKANYKGGKLDGNIKNFYESGKLKVEAYYTNGLRNGSYKSYFENGKLHEADTFRNDTLVYQIQYDSDLSEYIEYWYANLNGESDSLKEGEPFRGTVSTYEEDHFIKPTIDYCVYPKADFYKGNLEHPLMYFPKRNYLKNFPIVISGLKPGRYVIQGDVGFYLNGKLKGTTFEHNIVVY